MMPSARPILMSAPMVRALLAGTKTQTRRIVKPQPNARCTEAFVGCDGIWRFSWPTARAPMSSAADDVLCPYGKPGDMLWVRETWAVGTIYDGIAPRNVPECGVRYAATNERIGIKDRQSIHMPRWASRLTLEITEVRVERLQDITEADAKAEGAEQLSMDDDGNFYRLAGQGTYRTGYAGLWNHINGDKAGMSWDDNPWVWALTFKVHKANVDAVLATAKEPV